MVKFILFGWLAVLPVCSWATTLTSPNGQVQLILDVSNGQLVYSVFHSGTPVIEPSALGITVDDITYGALEKMGKETRGKIDERYPWRGVKSEVLNQCNTLLVDLDSGGHAWQLEARAYDDGVAFRYSVPGVGSRTVKGELTRWTIPEKIEAWYHTATKHYEGEFSRSRISQIPLDVKATNGDEMRKTTIGFPLTLELSNGSYALLSEANVMAYSGMTMEPDGSQTLTAVFEDDSDGWKMDGPITTPWRLVMVASDLNALVNNDLVHNVCPAPDPKFFPQGMNTEWVQAGRSLWQWWGYNNPGTHWSTQYWMVDQAAKLNCEYYLVDEGWEHTRQEWFAPGETAWSRLKKLCDYAAERGVKILVWRAWQPNEEAQFPGLETEVKREDFFRNCAEVGVKGVKVDFMNSESHDRLGFYADCLRKGAQYKITVNFHGANKPAGEPRTWPNEVTREGIKGLEHNKWGALPVEHYSILPFTRLVIGHGDFTPTTFQPEFMRGSTPGLQLAMAAISTSPAKHWADKPDIYLASPTVNMIRSMPTCWDETRVLAGSAIGETAQFIRRAGSVWYLAAINSKADRDFIFDMDFLGTGNYLADIVRDNPADRDAMIVEKRAVTSSDFITCKLLIGGGITVRFSKLRMEPFGNGFTDEQIVKIDRASPCEVYYTLDGSEPSATSEKLEGPSLVLKESARLRLKIVFGDGAGTDISAQFTKLPVSGKGKRGKRVIKRVSPRI